jgi:hypothetical protein
MKRIAVDMLLAGVLWVVILSGVHARLTGAAQLALLKALLVSSGFLHAHIAGKLAFPKVDWSGRGQFGLKLLRVALYVVFVYGWSTGG